MTSEEMDMQNEAMDNFDYGDEDVKEVDATRRPSANTFLLWLTILLIGMVLGGIICVFFLDGFLWRTEREAVYAKMNEMTATINTLTEDVKFLSDTVGRHEDAEMFKQTIEASGMNLGDNMTIPDRIKMIDQLWMECKSLSALSISQRLAILESAYLQRTKALAAMRKHRAENGGSDEPKTKTIAVDGGKMSISGGKCGNGGFKLNKWMERKPNNGKQEKGK